MRGRRRRRSALQPCVRRSCCAAVAIISPTLGVYVQRFPGTDGRYQVPKQPGAIDCHPVWAPDGTELFYSPSAGSGKLVVVRVITQPALEFGNPMSLPARVTDDRVSTEMRAYDILPDGRFVGLVPALEPASPGTVNEFRVVLNWFDELKARVPVN